MFFQDLTVPLHKDKHDIRSERFSWSFLCIFSCLLVDLKRIPSDPLFRSGATGLFFFLWRVSMTLFLDSLQLERAGTAARRDALLLLAEAWIERQHKADGSVTESGRGYWSMWSRDMAAAASPSTHPPRPKPSFRLLFSFLLRATVINLNLCRCVCLLLFCLGPSLPNVWIAKGLSVLSCGCVGASLERISRSYAPLHRLSLPNLFSSFFTVSPPPPKKPVSTAPAYDFRCNSSHFP